MLQEEMLKIIALEKWYGTISDILSQSGFDWDGIKHMIAIDDESAWNEYVKVRYLICIYNNLFIHVSCHKKNIFIFMIQTYIDGKTFQFKVIPTWDDIVNLCAKDKGTENEDTIASVAMSKEATTKKTNGVANDFIDASWSTT